MAYKSTPIDFEGSDADNLPSAGSKINTNLNDIQEAFDYSYWQAPVLDKDLNAPPGGESEGDRYIVGPAPSGAWTGHEGEIAEYRDGSYVFFIPQEGFCCLVIDEQQYYFYYGEEL